MSDSIISNPVKPIDMEKLNIKDLIKGKFLKDVNFLNHIGYFCHDYRKAKEIKKTQTFVDNTRIQGQKVEMIYSITPHANYGYPSITAFKICDFIDRILSYYGRPAMNPIPFDMVSLRESLGLTKAGKNYQIIKTALKQLRFTSIETSHFFLNRSKKYIETDYTIIDKLVFVGENSNDIKAGLIYINKDIIKSFNNKNQMPVNHERYADLSTPSKALYLKLFRQFSAARQIGKESSEITVENDYHLLCHVLGFTPQKYKSRIVQQLKPHMVPLKDIKQLVKSWNVKKKSSKTGFKLQSSPGSGFDEDHAQFNKNVNEQLVLDYNKRDEDTVAEIEAVRYFHEKLFDIKQDDLEDSHINKKDIDFVKRLLKTFPGKKIYEFIDYSIAEAEKTDFPIKTFRGMEGFINAFKGMDIKRKKAKEIIKVQQDSQNKEEEAKELYIQFINETYTNYLETLNPNERREHEEAVHNKIINTTFYKGKDKNSPIYIGLKGNAIREFTETTLINDFDFRAFLKNNKKDYLLDIKFK